MISQSTFSEMAEDIVESKVMKEVLLSAYTQLNFTFMMTF